MTIIKIESSKSNCSRAASFGYDALTMAPRAALAATKSVVSSFVTSIGSKTVKWPLAALAGYAAYEFAAERKIHHMAEDYAMDGIKYIMNLNGLPYESDINSIPVVGDLLSGLGKTAFGFAKLGMQGMAREQVRKCTDWAIFGAGAFAADTALDVAASTLLGKVVHYGVVKPVNNLAIRSTVWVASKVFGSKKEKSKKVINPQAVMLVEKQRLQLQKNLRAVFGDKNLKASIVKIDSKGNIEVLSAKDLMPKSK